MNRLTKHQVLPALVVRERMKQRLFRFIYEHNDRDFLDVISLLLEHIVECNDTAIGGLDERISRFLDTFDENHNPNQNRLL